MMPSAYIHRFVPGKSSFTVLTLHDHDGDENDLLPVGRALAPGAGVLSPRLRADEEVVRLADWVEAAAAHYGLDATKIFALGYAYGADLAAGLLLRRPGAIAGGILLRPSGADRPEPLPQLNGAPVLIAAGQEDPLFALSRSEDLARLLRDAGATVDLAVQNTGHDLTPQDFALGKRWFDQALRG